MSTPFDYTVKKAISYRYTALNAKGKMVKGRIKSTSEGMASNALAEKGLHLVTIRAIPAWYSIDQMFPSLFAVKPIEITNFSRQLATLLEAGISILPALESVRQQASSRGFKRVLTEIINDLSSGQSFSETLTKHAKVFSEIYTKTIGVAESTGNIHNILRQLASYQEKQDLTKKKIKKALTYPAVMLSLALVVGVILMTTALPPLIDMFTQLDAELPVTTRFLIGLTNFLTKYKIYLLVGAILLALSLVYTIKQPGARKWLDGMLLKLPVLGPPLHSAEIGRFSRTSQVLIMAGLSLQEVMELVPSTSGNMAFKAGLQEVQQDLIRGEGIYEPMLKKGELFPRLLTQMIRVGEDSNSLDYTLGVVADFYESDSDEKITNFIAKIQPTMTMVMAGVVGFLALSLIMPMYSITGAI